MINLKSSKRNTNSFGDTELDVQKAVHFIEENGTELEKYRLHYLLGKERNKEYPLRCLRELQNHDGGFPYGGEKGKLSSVNVTSGRLNLMIELRLDESDVCRKTAKYLLNIQNEDGSWDEDEAINQYNPPFWNTPGDLKTKMWLTANISNHLIQLSHRESEAIRKATEFLLKNRDDEGKFAGFLHSTWISIGVFGQLEGINSEVVKKALRVIDRNINRMENGVSSFTWCLECFYVAGVPKENSVAQKCIYRVIKLQSENGAWVSEGGEKYAVSATINALRVLKMYKVW